MPRVVVRPDRDELVKQIGALEERCRELELQLLRATTAAPSSPHGGNSVDSSTSTYADVAARHSSDIVAASAEPAIVEFRGMDRFNAELNTAHEALLAMGAAVTETAVTAALQPTLIQLTAGFRGPDALEEVTLEGQIFQLVDTHATQTLNGLLPDGTITKHGISTANIRAASVLALFEWKIRKRDPATFGQLYRYAEEVFLVHQSRKVLVIFLCDMAGIIRCDATVEGRTVKLVHFDPVDWRRGAGVVWKALVDLQTSLGCSLATYGPFAVVSVLGGGATATVYEAQKEVVGAPPSTVTVAVKVALSTGQRSADVIKEFGFLDVTLPTLLAPHPKLLQHVPYGVLWCGGDPGVDIAAFSMTPVGVRFGASEARFRHCHVESLVAVLAAIHSKGFVHRDVRQQNILHDRKSADTVLLVDWAFAIPLPSDPVQYSGTLFAASDEVLASSVAAETGFLHKSTPSDDLHALIRSAYFMTFPEAYKKLKSRMADVQFKRGTKAGREAYANCLRTFWTASLGYGGWDAATRCASAQDHGGVASSLPVAFW